MKFLSRYVLALVLALPLLYVGAVLGAPHDESLSCAALAPTAARFHVGCVQTVGGVFLGKWATDYSQAQNSRTSSARPSRGRTRTASPGEAGKSDRCPASRARATGRMVRR